MSWDGLGAADWLRACGASVNDLLISALIVAVSDDEGILYNPRLRRIYRAAEDHLVMLADRAKPVPQQEHQRLLKRARHGDAVGTAGLLVERVDGKQSIGEIGAGA